jgi:hypothetical protein
VRALYALFAKQAKELLLSAQLPVILYAKPVTLDLLTVRQTTRVDANLARHVQLDKAVHRSALHQPIRSVRYAQEAAPIVT